MVKCAGSIWFNNFVYVLIVSELQPANHNVNGKQSCVPKILQIHRATAYILLPHYKE